MLAVQYTRAQVIMNLIHLQQNIYILKFHLKLSEIPLTSALFLHCLGIF